MQDVDVMWEADAAAEWERINEPDPYENQMKIAARSLDKALDELNDVIGWVQTAEADLHGSPMADKVSSFAQDLDNIYGELRNLKEHYERGERE